MSSSTKIWPPKYPPHQFNCQTPLQFYPTPCLSPGYCRCLRLSVYPSVVRTCNDEIVSFQNIYHTKMPNTYPYKRTCVWTKFPTEGVDIGRQPTAHPLTRVSVHIIIYVRCSHSSMNPLLLQNCINFPWYRSYLLCCYVLNCNRFNNHES